MGKEMRRKHSIENETPGCMWGIFHLFDFHQRHHHVRRMISDKRHGSGNHSGGGTKFPSMKLNAPSNDEAHDFVDAGLNNFFEVNMKEMSPNKSGKLRMRALIAEEMSKENERKRPIQSFPARLLRTDSIHHLECAEFVLPEEMTADTSSPRLDLHLHDTSASNTCNPPLPKPPEDPVIYNKQCEVCGTMNGINYLGQNQLDELGKQLHEKHALLQEKLDDTQGVLLQQKSVPAKEPARDVAALRQSKQFLGTVEIFNASRELFLKILQDQNSVRANQFHSQQTSRSETVFTKSESFPRVGLSEKRNSISKLAKLKHEEKETGPEIAGIVTSLENRRDDGVVVSRFKDIKQRIRHAIKESRKEAHRISMDGILHKIPYGRKASKDAREIVNQWKESTIDRDNMDTPRSSYSSDSTALARTKDAPAQMRRASSLSESLDRYSKLLEFPLNEEPKKHLSDRLETGNEIDDSALEGRCSRTFGRIFSLPEYESYFSASDLQGDALDKELEGGNGDAESHSPDEHNPASTLKSTENCTQLDNFVKNEGRELYVEVNASGPVDGDADRLILDAEGDEFAKRGDICNDSDGLIENKGIPPYEETWSLKYDSTKLAEPSPISVLESCFQEDIPSFAEFTVSKGSVLEPRQIHFDDPDLSINPEDQSSMDVSNGVGSATNFDEVQIYGYNDHVDFLVDSKDEAEFNYVRAVLKKSGFSGAEFLGTWYSPDQPVDPSLFEEVDTTPLELDMTEHDQSSNYYCQLLFDLINEVLLEIYERSFNSQIRPMPVGYHVLEEVWTSICRHFNLQPQLDPSLDYVVAQDLAKTDGWMNLQPDTECVALDLEVLILDDLLEEATTILLDGVD